MMHTVHADQRSRQRGLPPLVLQWLEAYGAENHDGHGAVILYFDKRARRRLEMEIGREPVRRMSEWLNAYAVVANDGQTITVGHRYKRIKH